MPNYTIAALHTAKLELLTTHASRKSDPGEPSSHEIVKQYKLWLK